MDESNALPGEERKVVAEEILPIVRPRTLSFPSGISTRSRVFCSVCQEIVGLVTVADAAAEYNTDLQDIRFLLDRRHIHAVPRDPAVISICRNSLVACFESRKTRLLDSHFELELQHSMSGEHQG